jgi:predicted PurR-regulated permease PerM
MRDTLSLARLTLVAVAIFVVLAVWALRDLALLVGFSVMLAYALLPAVRAIERVRMPWKRSLPRGVVAAGLMLALVAIGCWLLALILPRLAAEAARFASNAPAILAGVVEDLHSYSAERGFSPWLDPAVERARAELPALLRAVGGSVTSALAGLFGGVGQILGLALLPLLAFYLLAEAGAVRTSALRFVPEQARPEITRLSGAVDRALRSYVRGQAIVCVVTGLSVTAGLALLHHPVALLIGLLAGIAEVIPYVGFLVVAGAIVLSGLTVSPLQALLGLALYAGLNWTIGTFVTPRVMGRYLKMHPFVVTVSVLAGAQLLGAGGALLALPVAAVFQAVIGELAPARGRAGRAAADGKRAGGD